MSKHFAAPNDARATHFDWLHPIELPTEPEALEAMDLQVMERGSDLHIAFLEQALKDLQATLDQLKAERAARGS